MQSTLRVTQPARAVCAPARLACFKAGQAALQPAARRRVLAAPILAAAAGGQSEVSITVLSSGAKQAMPAPRLTVGPGAELAVTAAEAGAAPATLELKAGRLYCTAAPAPGADPDAFLAPTNTWLDGVELRAGVAYLVAPGAELGFGSPPTPALRFDFTEAGGAGAMADMLMQGMAAQASKEVQEQFNNLRQQ